MCPFDELEPTDLVELRPFCLWFRNRDSHSLDGVADTKLVLFVGFGAYGHFEMGVGNAVDLSAKDQSVSLVLMGWDLIERPDQADASLDADNPACE